MLRGHICLSLVSDFVACENIHFSSLFPAGDVSRAAKSEEKRMFSQATDFVIYM